MKLSSVLLLNEKKHPVTAMANRLCACTTCAAMRRIHTITNTLANKPSQLKARLRRIKPLPCQAIV